MANGPGKYDKVCTSVRESTQAQAVILLVFNGNEGSGFSVQAVDQDLSPILADILEETARQIRDDLARSAH